MKVNEIHNGLENFHIRDFLSKTLVDVLHKDLDSTNRKKVPPFNKEDPMQWAIDQANLEIDFWKFQLEKATAKKAVIELIKMNGWKEHDLSEYVELEDNQIFFPAFIGTEEEYKALLKKEESHD